MIARVGKSSELAWAIVGIMLTLGMYHAYAVWGAIAMFAAIGLAFVVWYKVSPRGAWIAVAVVGVSMATLLGVQAATSSRCPTGNTGIQIKAGDAPSGAVGCNELRASAGSMAVFFAFLGLMGLAAPLYFRRRDEDDLEDEASPAAPVAL